MQDRKTSYLSCTHPDSTDLQNVIEIKMTIPTAVLIYHPSRYMHWLNLTVPLPVPRL
jgi:hypothetical protein